MTGESKRTHLEAARIAQFRRCWPRAAFLLIGFCVWMTLIRQNPSLTGSDYTLAGIFSVIALSMPLRRSGSRLSGIIVLAALVWVVCYSLLLKNLIDDSIVSFLQAFSMVSFMMGAVPIAIEFGYSLSPLWKQRTVSFWKQRKYSLILLGGGAYFAILMVLLGARILFPALIPLSISFALIHSVLFFVLSVLFFYRQTFELFLEPFVWVLYSIRAKEPRPYRFPLAGPVLVVANHACWMDPLFLGKVLPRPITPMMTEKFYRIGLLRPFLRYVFRVIVVPDVPLRREAPELDLAIAALDRGEVVVIFPEGALRRKDEVPLKRFGQGVWKILRDRPQTPVVSCWIEGGWGDYFSYKGGPPMKNKRFPFRKRIDVAMGVAETVPEETLADGMATRLLLMNRVLAARSLLGLPELPEFEMPKSEEASGGA